MSELEKNLYIQDTSDPEKQIYFTTGNPSGEHVGDGEEDVLINLAPIELTLKDIKLNASQDLSMVFGPNEYKE